MRIDRQGRLLKQITIWIEAEQYELLKLDGLNVSEFVRDQIASLYEDPAEKRQETRDKLAQAARETAVRARAAAADREAARDRARDNVRRLRAERQAALSRQDAIAAALLQIIGDDPPARLARLLPENDPNGDRVDDWEALVRRVSRLCGAEIDSAEVAVGVRALVAKA